MHALKPCNHKCTQKKQHNVFIKTNTFNQPEYVVFTPPIRRCSSGGGRKSITWASSSAEMRDMCTTFPKYLADDGFPPASVHASSCLFSLQYR